MTGAMLDGLGFPRVATSASRATTRELGHPARRWAALRADQQLVGQAAAQLRRQAIREGYAGVPG